MPHVSVVIPAYNAERFIVETVNSALNQTYQDLEVIVVDDGSKDGTVAALAQFGNRIRVHQQANGGVAKARNTGVSLARGTYIAFLDADDLWLPQKLERQLTSTAPMSYTDRLNIGERGHLPELHSEIKPMRGGDLFVPLMREQNFITSTSVMLRRALFEKMGGFYTGLNGTEDWDLWIRIAEAPRDRLRGGAAGAVSLPCRRHQPQLPKDEPRAHAGDRARAGAGARPLARLADASPDLG